MCVCVRAWVGVGTRLGAEGRQTQLEFAITEPENLYTLTHFFLVKSRVEVHLYSYTSTIQL